MAPCDIRDSVRMTLDRVRNYYRDPPTIVDDVGRLPHVTCHAGQIGQVFLHLLINACEAVAGGGHVQVSSGRRGDRIWVSVADSGCGIQADVLPHIFDTFYTTKPPGQGTGLGLSLSCSIVKAHNGDIEVTSTPGAGSVFTVWLPIRQRRARLRSPLAAARLQRTGSAAPTAATEAHNDSSGSVS